MEKLKSWSSSQHPFDLWFKGKLTHLFENTLEQAHLLLDFDAKK